MSTHPKSCPFDIATSDSHLVCQLNGSCKWLTVFGVLVLTSARAFTTVFAGPIAIADPSVGWKTWIWFLVFNFIAIPYGKSQSSEMQQAAADHSSLLLLS